MTGTVPIPPYLDREVEATDENAYNNVYSTTAGSVAAPTAGLHFTDEVLQRIGRNNTSFLSLHVGAGTFRPVVGENVLDHAMHAENFEVRAGAIMELVDVLASGKPLVAVGTTCARTLETFYWCGVKAKTGQTRPDAALTMERDEWRSLVTHSAGISPATALASLAEDKHASAPIRGSTSLMIVPQSYEFKVVQNLVTNFHAPDSTLMLLVAAFLGNGEKVQHVYEDAQRRGYKFLSYGDVCFFSAPITGHRK